jgi:hypothetical protein
MGAMKSIYTERILEGKSNRIEELPIELQIFCGRTINEIVSDIEDIVIKNAILVQFR